MFKNFKLLLLSFSCLFFLPLITYANTEEQGQKLFTIRLPLTVGEQVLVIAPDGGQLEMGKMRVLPMKSKYPGFTASRYGEGAQVIASASNAHHIQLSVENGKGRTISVLPTETYVATSGMGSSFIIEGAGGFGLWGEFAPFVGSPVFIVYSNKNRVPFTDAAMLSEGEAVEIDVYAPRESVDYIEIENREGGSAWYRDAAGKDHPFATVESEVRGTGRFSGTLYQGQSMVRANHPGVICISTTPRGDIGGFQIIPLTHTYSKEMQSARHMGQYLVLRGIDFEDLTGRFPFFRGGVRPGDERNTTSNVGKVLCKIKGNWYPLPLMSEWTEESLTHIEAIRIFLR